MATRNDVTGQEIKSRSTNTEAYASNWDAIFGKKKEEPAVDETPEDSTPEQEQE